MEKDDVIKRLQKGEGIKVIKEKANIITCSSGTSKIKINGKAVKILALENGI